MDLIQAARTDHSHHTDLSEHIYRVDGVDGTTEDFTAYPGQKLIMLSVICYVMNVILSTKHNVAVLIGFNLRIKKCHRTNTIYVHCTIVHR